MLRAMAPQHMATLRKLLGELSVNPKLARYGGFLVFAS